MCASPENSNIAAAETFMVVEGNTESSARARMAGAAGVYGIGTCTRVWLQPGRPSCFPRGEEPRRVGEREGVGSGWSTGDPGEVAGGRPWRGKSPTESGSDGGTHGRRAEAEDHVSGTSADSREGE